MSVCVYECMCVCVCVCVYVSNTSTCVVHMCVVSPTCMPSVTLPNVI